MILKPGIKLQFLLYFVPDVARWIVYYVHKLEQLLEARIECALLPDG